ncbi:alpha/beta fold hydrolase [Nocardioides sp.]|uniref:alpha/beta fold hydrolase n=1 Tax=Nocardioides sp. TaxID=35761 RepID=UPI002B27541E|nr:alpha/beta fold hydrolase [Nocardioides sp.]
MTAADWGTRDPAWAGVREDVLDLGGRTVRVLRADGRPGATQPQVLVHGLGGSASNWIDVIAGLASYGPVVALDLGGFGHTPAESAVSLGVDGHIELVLAVADHLEWATFALHGNSMGGLVGTLLAADHPHRVEHLVLVSPALPPSCPLAFLPIPRATWSGVVPMALPSRRTHQLMRLIFNDPTGIRPALLEAMATDSRPRDEHHAAERSRALLASTRSIAALWLDPRRVYRAVDELVAPTLVLGGTADALVPARVLRKVLARRADWAGEVLSDHRHALMLDAPAEYLARVAAWRAESDSAVA